MRDLLAVITDRLDRGDPLAMATVVSRKGSAPRGSGARLLANASGLIHGTIGGGASEAAVLDACADVLREGGCRLLELTLTNAMAAKEGMACGGEVRVFVEPLTPDEGTREFFAAATAACCTAACGESGVLLSRLASGRDVLPERTLYAAGEFTKLPPGGEAAVVVLDGVEHFAEPLLPQSRMIIAGAGHVAVPTATLASFAHFTVHVIDDRAEFARPERFSHAASVSVVPEFDGCLASFAPDERTCIVIVTRGHLYDEAVLAQALRTGAGYIGMIGSRKKRETVYAALRARGFGDADLARVHCPVGLDIGAETPEEIAVSIVAECIAHKRGRGR